MTPKPYYQGHGVALYCGDNVEILKTFDEGCIDLTVTSPPYDNLRTYGGHQWGWDEFTRLAPELFRVTKPGGVVVWIVNDATVDGSETGTSFRQALYFKDVCGFRLLDTMIWNKPPAGANGSSKCYSQSSEFMFVLSKGKPATVNRLTDRKNLSQGKWQNKSTGGRCEKNNAARRLQPTVKTPEFGLRTNVWECRFGSGSDDYTPHTAIFPEALARDHILSWSNEGDTVLDCFNGSGTTTKMAKHMARKAIGIEINAEYCDIAINRLRQCVLDFAGE